jgi:hypothetical protein
MAVTAWLAAIRSVTGIPIFTGDPSCSPVMDINPVIPLNDGIIGLFIAIGARLAKTGNSAVDDCRVCRFEGVIVDSQLGGDTGGEIFHHYIGILRQF